MRLALFGVTGATGKHLLELALAAGHDVTASARRPTDVTVTHPKLRVVQSDLLDGASVERVLQGQDAVVSAAGSRTLKKNSVRSEGARNIVSAAKRLGVKRLVWLSASGVGDSLLQAQRSSFVFGRILIPVLLGRVYADGAIADATVAASGLEWVVVRPVELLNKPATGKVQVVPPNEKIPRLSIPRADVAAFMLEQLGPKARLSQMPVICSGNGE
jgi:putative NADH-flavin reductase